MDLEAAHYKIMKEVCKIYLLKDFVSVISSDPPCKDGNVRFTTVPLNADQV